MLGASGIAFWIVFGSVIRGSDGAYAFVSGAFGGTKCCVFGAVIQSWLAFIGPMVFWYPIPACMELSWLGTWKLYVSALLAFCCHWAEVDMSARLHEAFPKSAGFRVSGPIPSSPVRLRSKSLVVPYPRLIEL